MLWHADHSIVLNCGWVMEFLVPAEICTIVLLSARRWALGVVAGCAATCAPRSQVAALVQPPYVEPTIGSVGILYQHGASYCQKNNQPFIVDEEILAKNICFSHKTLLRMCPHIICVGVGWSVYTQKVTCDLKNLFLSLQQIVVVFGAWLNLWHTSTCLGQYFYFQTKLLYITRF